MKKLLCTVVAALATALAFSDETVVDFGNYVYDKSTGRIEIMKDMPGLNIGADLTDGTEGTVNYSLRHAITSAGDMAAREPTEGAVMLGRTTRFTDLKEGDSIAFTLVTAGGTVESTTFTDSFVDRTTSSTGSSIVQFGSSGSMNIKTSPSGGPLPGLLAVLLVGGVGAGAFKLRKPRA